MLDYEQTFELSYERVVGHGVGTSAKGQAFFEKFYEKFFASSEEVREKFSATDMGAQIGMLQKSMYHMVGFYVLKTENEYLSGIAKSHSRHHYDIPPRLYDQWLEALVDAVREMDPEFDHGVELAWRIAMSPGILYLKSRYDL